MVGRKEGLAGCAEGAEGVEVELGEVVGVGVFGLGLWGRAAVHGGSGHAHGRGAGRGAAGLVGREGEGFEFGLVV